MMTKTATGLATLMLLATLVASPASAQDLTHGVWSGTMTPPGGQPVPVSFEVDHADGALSIVMTSVMIEGGMPFQDVQVDADGLTFWWDPGVRVECALQRTDAGSLEGPCTDGREGGAAGAMSMVPPA